MSLTNDTGRGPKWNFTWNARVNEKCATVPICRNKIMMTTSVVLFTSLLLQPIAVPSDGLLGDAAFAAGGYATAYKAWEAQANAGNAAAMLGIGVLYDTGHGVPQNFATALF